MLNLKKDKRLVVPVTYGPKYIESLGFAKLARSLSSVRFEIEEGELSYTRYYLAVKEKPLYVVMDAIASVYLSTWVLEPNKVYNLKSDDIIDGRIYSADNNSDKTSRNRIGMEIIDGLKNNTSLMNKLMSPQGITADQLPDSLYHQFLEFAKVDEESVKSRLGHGESTTSESSLPRNSFHMNIKKEKEGSSYNVYRIGYSSPAGGGSFAVSDYDKRLKETNNNRGNNVDDPNVPYTVKKMEIPRRDAIKNPELQKIVNINLKRANIRDVIKEISVKYNYDFACDSMRNILKTTDLNIDSLPMFKALDLIASTYGGIFWELRRSGFIVIRSFDNPAQDPKQGVIRKRQ